MEVSKNNYPQVEHSQLKNVLKYSINLLSYCLPLTTGLISETSFWLGCMVYSG